MQRAPNHLLSLANPACDSGRHPGGIWLLTLSGEKSRSRNIFCYGIRHGNRGSALACLVQSDDILTISCVLARQAEGTLAHAPEPLCLP